MAMAKAKASIIKYYIIIILSLFGVESDYAPIIHPFCNDTFTYKPNSTFQINLEALLSSLTSVAGQNDGYSTAVEGWGTTDSISGQILCRGDVTPATCQDCVDVAAKDIARLCPNQTESIIFYDYCWLRYTNQSFKFDSVIASALVNVNNASDESKFNQVLSELLNDVAEKAANLQSSSGKKFGTHEVEYRSGEKMYGLGQCTPDLTLSECKTCFRKAIAYIGTCCAGKMGGRVLLAGCNIRYEMYAFYNVTTTESAPPQLPPVPPPPGKSDTGSSKVVVAIVVPIIVLVILFGMGCYLLRRKTRKRDKAILRENFGEEGSNLKSLRFSLAVIEAATNKFSHENRIGKGGFGEVYKGVLPDGREIAVKRLSKSSGQGVIEFKNEIFLIAKLQHRNLVALLGFCLEQQEKILIYEYVPNKSIDCFLFDSEKGRLLNWFDRFKIIKGIARGLLYLHEHSRLKVIHRDLKPSNVLLDNDMNPKISDFGMARMIAIDQDQGNTKRIVGTYGYMPPEYLIDGQFSEKSDIFSFGVIILEAISSKRNARSYDSHLLTHAWKEWNDGTPIEVLDPFLLESCSQIEVIRCVQIGLLCVQENPDDRPTMAEIVSYFSNTSIELPFPKQPAFFMHSRENPTMAADLEYLGQFSQSSKPSSTNEMSKSELFPR